MATLVKHYEMHKRLYKNNAVWFEAFKSRLYRSRRPMDKAIRTPSIPNNSKRQSYRLANKARFQNISVAGVKVIVSDKKPAVVKRFIWKVATKEVEKPIKNDIVKKVRTIKVDFKEKYDNLRTIHETLRSEHEKLLTSQIKENQAMFIWWVILGMAMWLVWAGMIIMW